MDTHRRLLAKAVTWQVMGLVAMMAIGWFFTGSFTAGGGIAIVGMITGFCTYFLHEAAWARVTWGRLSA